MKVLHIGEYIKGGVATYLKEVVAFQEKSKDISKIVLVLAENSDENLFAIEENIRKYEYQRNIRYYFKALKFINRQIKEINPDIIHAHSSYAGLFVRLLSLVQKRNYKIVYCSHGWSFLMEVTDYKKRIYAIIERILAYKTDKIINISLNEHVKAIEFGIPKNKCVLISNGLSDKFDAKDVQLNLDKRKINLLFVGRFDHQKGLDILIEFFENNPIQNIQVYIIGEKVLNNEWIEIPNNFINLGWIDNNLLPSYYSLFDAVIIPSRWEGFGLVALEAMRSKKTIIVSNRGALPELINNDNGYAFDLDNLDSLKEILEKLTHDELKRKGINGYLYFKKKFTSEKMNKEILKIYKEMMGNGLEN